MTDQFTSPYSSIGVGAQSVTSTVHPTTTPTATLPNASILRSSAKPRQMVRACDLCRQMKVKCDGFDHPPCVRCRKSGKECLFQSLPPDREQHRHGVSRKRGRPGATGPPSPDQRTTVQQLLPVNSAQSCLPRDSVPATKASTQEDSVVQTSWTRGDLGADSLQHSGSVAAQNEIVTTDLPSIYSTCPLDAVNEPDMDGTWSTKSAEKLLSVRRKGQETPLSVPNAAQTPTSDDSMKIPRRDLRGIIKLFREKLLPTIPVLSVQDFQDADHLITADFPLVCCICYVTARFLPGGKQLREVFMPEVAQILNGTFTSGRQLSTLKALIVLYSYASVFPPSAQDSKTTRPEEILYWPLKSLVEIYALRLCLHRSVYDLRTVLRLREDDTKSITETTSYQRYTLWLQLFIMAKYASITSGTPPSIPIDSTIRAAPLLMEEIGMNPQAGLFAQAELSIIWEKVGSQRQLGEWWCLRDPSQIIDEHETKSVLREADHLIDVWYAKWEDYINDEEGTGAFLDYHGRCSRFWVNSYATKYLQNSPAGLTPIQKDQVRTCVVYASRVLDWPLDRSPFQKESLRYVSEFAGIMVSFCCLYIIATCQTFGSSMPELYSNLDKVAAAAQLMLDLAPDIEHSGHVQGLLILRKTTALREQIGVPQIGNSSTVGPIESNLLASPTSDQPLREYQHFNLDDEAFAGMDFLWDFSMLTTPRTW